MKLPTPMQGAPIKVPSVQPLVSALKQSQAQDAALAGAAINVGSKIVAERNDEQQNTAFSKANNSMHDFDRAHADREFYSGDEIPESIDVKRTEVSIDAEGNEVETIRQRIPAYEVQAQMRDAHMRGSIGAAAADISSPSRRAQFSKQMTERANAQNIKMLNQQAKAQNQQIRDKQSQEFKAALMDRDYESASYIANNFNGTDEQRTELSRQVRYFNESDSYNDVMSEENVKGIDKSIGILEKDGYGGELNEVQRLATLNQLRSKKTQIAKKNQAKVAGSATMLGVEIDRTIDAMEDGKDVPPSVISRLSKRAQAGIEAGLVQGAAWEKRLAFFQEATGNLQGLQDFKTSTLQEQEQTLRELESSASTGTDYHKIDIYRKNHEYAKSAVRNDPLSYAAETGIVDVQPFDFDRMGLSLSHRQQARASTMDVLGQEAGNSFFTKQELTDFTARLDQMPVDDKLRTIGEITATLDSGSRNAVFSQLVGKGKGTYAVAGDAIEDGFTDVARQVLTGSNALKAQPEIVARWKYDMAPVVADKIGTIYRHSPTTGAQVTESVKAYYAQQSINDGDFTGELDTERLENAITQVVGKYTDIGGAKVLMPKRDMTADQFDSWVRDIQPNYIESIGGVKGYSGTAGTKMLTEQIRDGDVTLENVGKGKYLILDPDKGYLSRKDSMSPFILEYNSDATMGSKW
ncbi:hypothetical protein VPHK225_0017 [Vibrio phage K225]|nr:hypothetical protein PODOV044v1_p0019 [Vibrio phage 23E28.1]QZI92072.1 hypothetical protein PODOV045v1_p0030 [Vibrio phage 69E27.1]